MNQPNASLKFSRKIQEFEYDDQNSVLTIYFNTNLIKRYFDVPQRIYTTLQKTIDKDGYYRNAIDGAFCVE
jgi:hypothetical protein